MDEIFLEISSSSLGWKHVEFQGCDENTLSVIAGLIVTCSTPSAPMLCFPLIFLFFLNWYSHEQNLESNPHTIWKRILTKIHIHDSTETEEGTNLYSCGVYLQYNRWNLGGVLRMVSYYASWMTSIIARVSEQSLHVTSATPEITTQQQQQQQTSNNCLLASLLNSIFAKPAQTRGVLSGGAQWQQGHPFCLSPAWMWTRVCECRVAVGGRWLDLCFKREWQSLAVFCGVTVARCLLMMINPRQLFTGWLCFTAALVRCSHGVGAGCHRRPSRRFCTCVGGWERGWDGDAQG